MRQIYSISKLALVLMVITPILSILALVMLIFGIYYHDMGRRYTANDLFCFSIIASLCWVLPFIVWFLKTWNFIPKAHNEGITPAKVVGFLMIPLYNFYWLFKIFPGLSRAIYQWRRETGAEERNCGESVAKKLCILWIFLVTGPIANLLLPLWIYRVESSLEGLEKN